jgi:hypothetical protein
MLVGNPEGNRALGKPRRRWEETKNIVAYSLKARIVESQQPAVTRQRPVKNNRRMVFSAHSVPMATRTTTEYVMPTLNNNCNRGAVFPTRSVPRCYKQDKLVRKPLGFSYCQLLLLEAGS